MKAPKYLRQKAREHRWNVKALVNKYGSDCYLCEKPIESMKDITIDHVIPLSAGGPDTLENMRLAHPICNNNKASLSLEEYHARYSTGRLAGETGEASAEVLET